ncbi:hypothetical protein KBZ10_14800, partial [Streptomyces sp. F63]|uniref:hypothetical protein n=1 Tax=Streptomyces sp. F63 TaxID=2824887 RepID=UPI001B36FB56
MKMVQLGTDGFRFHDVTVVNAPHWVVSGYRDDQITAAADDESEFGGTVEGVKVLGNWGWNGDGIPALRNTTVSNCFVSAFDDAFKLYSPGATVRDNTLWQVTPPTRKRAGFLRRWLSRRAEDQPGPVEDVRRAGVVRVRREP